MHIYYKTANMDEPRFVYQKSKDFPGYVAVMAQFMPTFEASQPQENQDWKINYFDNEEEFEEQDIDSSIESKFTYIFIVDRSGSMQQRNKMETTVEAMKLFI
jgi:Mg-chelatase subunit ChlD